MQQMLSICYIQISGLLDKRASFSMCFSCLVYATLLLYMIFKSKRPVNTVFVFGDDFEHNGSFSGHDELGKSTKIIQSQFTKL